MMRSFRLCLYTLVLTVGSTACMFSPSLTDGNYSCQYQSDCPEGMICEPSFGGVGKCFKRGSVIPDGGTGACDQEGDTRVCYSGQPGTSGIGECKSGTQICQNGSWSACQGEVVPKSAEICKNNLDDDCNGLIDDGCTCKDGETQLCYPGPDNTQGVGPCKSGTQVCQNQQWGPCQGAVLPQPEQCNGIDDNCNGSVDDVTPRRCYTGPPPTLGQGICRAGEERCVRGSWGPCQGETLPRSSETCNNNLDDNCNGQVDENCGCQPGEVKLCYSGPPASQGVGECKSGQQRCDRNGQLGPCEGEVTPKDEECNGRDDNCNGQTDEGVATRECYTGPNGTAGKGSCQSGKQACQRGSWGACVGQVLPAPAETCDDGIDNNCNGSVDEGCGCIAGEIRECYNGPVQTKGKGNCRAGKQTCTSTQKWGPCLGEITPKAEACDGQDNDCDGNVDGFSRRCYSGPSGTEGKGNCRSGAQSCVAGKWSPCQGQAIPQEEVCDGKDNNCDGTIDEGLIRACYTGTAGCKSDGNGGYVCQAPCKSGTQSCSNGLWGSCAGEVAGKIEVCDGQDNDCDGKVDGFSETCYTSQDGGCTQDSKGNYICKGECKAGNRVCNNGQYTICAGQAFKQPEVCDGKDNNCDGTIDEGCQCLSGQSRSCYTGASSTAGKGICKAGTQTCDQFGRWGVCNGQVLPKAETCNGVDDNCDGTIDGMTRNCYSGAAGCKPDGQGGYTCQAPCQSGKETCTAGKWGTCAGAVVPKTETCNGVDDDCNGRIDDGLQAPKCDKQSGVCQGAVKRCGGAQGWLPCSVADYGKDYQQTETNCDGLDNDCDGTTDGAKACGTCIFSTKAAQFAKTLPANCSPTTTCFDNCLNVGGKLYYCRNINKKGYLYTTYQDFLSACNTTSACIESVCNSTNEFCDGSQWRKGKPPGTNDDFCDGIDNNCNGTIDEGCTCQSPCTAAKFCKSPCTKCVKQPGALFPTCVP